MDALQRSQRECVLARCAARLEGRWRHVRRGPVDVSTFSARALARQLGLGFDGRPCPGLLPHPGLWRRAGIKALRIRERLRPFLWRVRAALACSNLAFQNSTDRADIAGGPLGKSVAPAHYEAGEAFFTCTHGGKPARAYIIAGTYIFASALRGMPSMWGTNLIDGFIAPAERFDWTRKVLLHMFLSIRSNPQWSRSNRRASIRPRAIST